MIIIGSTAIKHWYKDFKREPKDLDIATLGKSGRFGNVEFLENPVLLKCYSGDYLEPNGLATLKASHLMWNINWDKHQYDLQFLLKKGCVIDSNVFKLLYEYWNKALWVNKRSNLSMSKDEFFDNAINYDDNEHDSMHEIINPYPIYKMILKDGCDVDLDVNKYNLLSFEEKLDLVREEVMVMAWERYRNLDYRIAYSKMLKKFIINHAPFFCIQFILENYIELHKPKINYIKIINDGLQSSK